MIGAIIGDIIGSVYEWKNVKTTDFPLFVERSRFTDDTVMSIAAAECVLNGLDYEETFKAYGRRYINAGYGRNFRMWLMGMIDGPYNSYGNGSAMRVSPIGWAIDDLDLVLQEAERSAIVSHNHPEGVKGAQAVAAAVWMAKKGETKTAIKEYVSTQFGYDLNRTLDKIRPGYSFEVSCQGSVPEAIIAFLESNNFEDAIRKAISIGGDSDTIACIAGGIAHAFYKEIPKDIVNEAKNRLPDDLNEMLELFMSSFPS